MRYWRRSKGSGGVFGIYQLNGGAANDVSVARNVHFQHGGRQTGSSFNSTPDARLTSFQVLWWVLGIHQLRRSVTIDAVLQATFTMSLAALKLNMAAAKPEVVLTSAPEAMLTPFQMRIMCFRDSQTQQKCY